MRTITVQEFAEIINKANAKDKRFDVSSIDSYGLYVELVDCKIEVDMEEGGSNEIAMFKPNTLMEVAVALDFVEEICEEDNVYYIEFSGDIPDMEVKLHKELVK